MAKRKTSKPRKQPPDRRSRLRTIGKWLATGAVWSFILGLFAIGWFYVDLPDVEDNLAPSRRPTIWVMAADGTELAAVGDLYGVPVRLVDLPPQLPQAVLATEDRRYYDHIGIDFYGLARAMFANLRAGRIVQGGSTITQQVAKNLFLTPDRNLKRKIQEVMLALWLEDRFSKDQILELYLNRVYLGAGTYGVDAAARKYFGKSATEINTWQSAMLAGLLKAPSRYNPLADKDLAAARTKVVLGAMVSAGYLTDTQATSARKLAATSHPTRPGRQAPFFVDWVLDQVSDYVGGRDRDLIVQTTLLPRLQVRAENTLAVTLKRNGKQRRIGEGAVVVMSPDGAVRTMIGGENYGASQFNRATQARRQPGSAFKPAVYLAALKAGRHPEDVYEDAPVKIGKWQPTNFDGKYAGPMTMSDALARSVNTIAVRLAVDVGVNQVATAARSLGLDPGDNPDASIALGTAETTLLELTAAYAPFANGGDGVIPYGIQEIRDGGGNIFYRRKVSGTGKVVKPAVLRDMNRMLKRVITEGTGRNAAFGPDAAGKTGTSQNYRDAWFVGYSADYLTSVWLGNDDGSPMKGVTGGSFPAVIWRDVMRAAHEGVQPKPLPSSSPTPAKPDAPSGPQDDGGNFFTRLIERLTSEK
jgi:penicillin-binding protein 1A